MTYTCILSMHSACILPFSMHKNSQISGKSSNVWRGHKIRDVLPFLAIMLQSCAETCLHFVYDMLFHFVRWPLHSGNTPTLEKTRWYWYLLNTKQKHFKRLDSRTCLCRGSRRIRRIRCQGTSPCLVITPSQEVLVHIKNMPGARSTLLHTAAVVEAFKLPNLVWSEILFLGIGEHAGQCRNKSIDLGQGSLLHLVKPLHPIRVALFAQTSLLRLGVFRDPVFQGFAVCGRKRHALFVQLLQRQEILHRALRVAVVENLHGSMISKMCEYVFLKPVPREIVYFGLLIHIVCACSCEPCVARFASRYQCMG